MNAPRVYVRRRGRITRGQAKALSRSARWLVPMPDAPLDWSVPFGRTAPLLLEIGFGMGEALLATAREHPEWNCIGVDVYQPGIGGTLLKCEAEGVTNVRLVDGDARVLLECGIGDGALARVHLFFPDPWPKTRHHKRRLVDDAFASKLAARMAPHAVLHAATDWQPYAERMRAVFDARPELRNVTDALAPSVARATTRFEARGVRLGHDVFDLLYERI